MKTSSYVLVSSAAQRPGGHSWSRRPPRRAIPNSHPRSRLCAPRRLFALAEMRWAAIALTLFLAGLAAQLAGRSALAVRGRSTWPVMQPAGWEPGLAGLRALRGKTLDVDLLMVAAAIGAAAIGQVTRRRPADRHLRHLRRAGGGGDRTAPPRTGARPARPRARTRPPGSTTAAKQTVDAADLAVGDVDPGPPRRADRRRRHVLVRRQRGGPGHHHR